MPSAWSLTGAAAVLYVALAGPAAVEEPTFPLGPLSGIQKPFPNAAARAFLRPGGETALLQLGKALFFDQQVGSDGVACASCHRTRSGQGPGANLLLTANDFPQHELLVPTERVSNVLFDTNDTISSAGTRYGEFVSGGVSGNGLRDRCKSAEETIGPAGATPPRWRFRAAATTGPWSRPAAASPSASGATATPSRWRCIRAAHDPGDRRPRAGQLPVCPAPPIRYRAARS